MRELNLMSKGDLRWLDQPDPVLERSTDVIVRPFVVSRCDGDTLPLHHRVSRAMQAGLRLGRLDQSIGHICGPVPFKGPFAIGHEAVAEVVEVGADVTELEIGDRVVVPWSVSCGSCVNCERGLTSKCLVTRATPDGERTLSAYGFGPASGPYGGMVSDLLRVPHADHMLVKLPDGLDPLRVAAASDNLTDAWRTVVPHLQARAGARVLVVGGGGQSIGLYAAGLAVAHGASTVHYVDSSSRRRRIAEELGAETAQRGPKQTDAQGAYDIVVEAASSTACIQYALRSTATGGICTATGYYVATNTPIPLMHMYATDITLRLGVSHPRAFLPDLLAWVHANDFPAEKVTSQVGDFDDAPDVYDARTTKLVLYRDPLDIGAAR